MVIDHATATVSDRSPDLENRDAAGSSVPNEVFGRPQQGDAFTFDSSRHLKHHSNFLPMIAPFDRATDQGQGARRRQRAVRATQVAKQPAGTKGGG
jgi:hypothetical protein